MKRASESDLRLQQARLLSPSQMPSPSSVPSSVPSSRVANEYAVLVAASNAASSSLRYPPRFPYDGRFDLFHPALHQSLLRQTPLLLATAPPPFGALPSSQLPSLPRMYHPAADLAASHSVLTPDFMAVASRQGVLHHTDPYAGAFEGARHLTMPNHRQEEDRKRSVSVEKAEEDVGAGGDRRADQMHGPVKKRRTDFLVHGGATHELQNGMKDKNYNDNSARSRFKKKAAAAMMAAKKEDLVEATTLTMSPSPQVEHSHPSPSQLPRTNSQTPLGDESAPGPKSTSEAQWNMMFQRLVDYKATHGNCLVPQRCESDPRLGKWVCYQRKRRKNLSEERKRRLEDVGFVFCVRQLESWDVMYDQLVEYKRKNGDCLVPQNCAENPKLGKWVAIQRIYKDSLTAEKAARMEEIGFVWSVNQALWETMFESLVEYKAKHGHCRVPWNYRPDPQLANWVQRQRKNKKRLTLDRLERLQELGMELE